jgi:allophanate hydrolase subunit 1
MENLDKIKREIQGIETLVTAIQEDLKGLRDVHPGFVSVMIELDLLNANLKDIKDELINPF